YERFRLMLIDYPEGPVPTKWKGYWAEDRTKQADINEGSIALYFQQWCWQRYRKKLSDTAALDLAKDVLAKAAQVPPAPGFSLMDLIHDGVVETLKGF